MKLGIIPYLNGVPFLGNDEVRSPSFDFVFDTPSSLSRLLDKGDIDAGIIPVFDYLNGVGKVVLPHLSISCKGPVESVKLFYQPPLKDVKRIYADKASSTSAALVRILLKEVYNTEPKIIRVHSDSLIHCRHVCLSEASFVRAGMVSEPRGEDERAQKLSEVCHAGAKKRPMKGKHAYHCDNAHGILHIGNLAFRKIKGYRELDLGEAWYEWTHLPFVFALWVSSHLPTSKTITKLLSHNLEWTMKNIDDISIRKAKELNLRKEFIKNYLTKSVNYSLGKRHIKAIERFQDLCLKHNLLKTKRKLKFHNV